MKTQFISLLIALLAGLLPLQAQQVSISGIVTDKKLNEPIIGASVVVKGTSNGCITDLDGNFQLNNVASGSIPTSVIKPRKSPYKKERLLIRSLCRKILRHSMKW